MASKKKCNQDADFEAMVRPAPNQMTDGETEVKTAAPKKVEPPKPKLIQTGFYITEKQHKSLKMKALTENSDQSEIIRGLINENLKDYMDLIK